MSCEQFLSKHVEFVDDLLSAVEMTEMAEHRRHCPSCERQDTKIRRSLILVRTLLAVDDMPDFRYRRAALRNRIFSACQSIAGRKRYMLPSETAFSPLSITSSATRNT